MLLVFYILKELIFPFFMALGIILSILLMERIFKFIPFLSAIGADIDIFVWLIVYSLPTIFMLATPLALVAGIYAGINRLSNDYEITAIRASGLSLSFLFKPVLALSSPAAFFVMLNCFYLSPQSLVKLEELKFDILKKQAKISFSAGRINNLPGKTVYISKRENNMLKGVVMADLGSADGYTIVEARKGKIYFDEKTQKIIFNLYKGKTHQFSADNSYRLVRFERLDYNFSFLDFSSGGDSTPSQKTDIQLTVNELIMMINAADVASDDYFEYMDELHSRVAMILSCVCFSILSLALGIYNPRTSKTGNIVYLGLVLIVYFWAHAQVRNWIVEGKIGPWAIYPPLLAPLFVGFLKYHKLKYNIGLFRRYFGAQKS